MNLDFLGNIAPGGVVIVYYMCKAFAQINSVTSAMDIEDFIVATNQSSSYSPTAKHTMNTNPLRWKSRRKIKFREGEHLYLIVNVKSDVANLAGTLWGHMKI